MTNEEIKKGLEYCKTDWCVRCPYFDCIGCEVFLKQDALTLITKQEQEIAELKAAKNDWKQRYESLDQRYMALVASSVECMDKKVKKAKIDVLNELKKYSYCDNDFMDGKWRRYVFVNDIDVLLEKYANDNHRY